MTTDKIKAKIDKRREELKEAAAKKLEEMRKAALFKADWLAMPEEQRAIFRQFGVDPFSKKEIYTRRTGCGGSLSVSKKAKGDK